MAKIIDSLTLGSTTGVLSIPYTTCATAAATAAKVATLTTFVLEVGAQVRIKFTYANSVADPTLNINGTGAKAIFWRGAALASTQYWAAGQILDFIYDGTNWVLMTQPKDNNTTYSLSGLGGIGSVSASGTAPLSLSATKSGTSVSISGSITVATDTTPGVVKIGYTESGKNYPVELNGSNQMYVNVPWENTTYSANNGIKLENGTFSHTNSITAKTTQNQSNASPGYGGTFIVTEPKYDAQGHITGIQQATITMPSAQTIPTSLKNPKALTIKTAGTSKGSYDGANAIEINITAADLGLDNAMHFLGTSTTAITDGGAQTPTINNTTITPVAGDVVLYGNQEFVYNSANKWELLGDEGSYALKTVSITAGNGLTGGGTIAASRTLNVGAGTGITVSADAVAAKLRSTTALAYDSTAATITSGRVYPIAVDKSGYLSVNVPWTDNNTVTTASTTGSGNAVTSITATNGVLTVTKGATFKTTQNAVTSPTANGSTTSFIDTISQNTNGVITVTKKNLDTSGTWSGNAATATQATQDGSGNVITSTYLKKTGDTASGNIGVSKASGSVSLYCNRSDTSAQISLMIGSSGTSKGIWDNNINSGSGAWLCYTDGTHTYFGTSSAYGNAYLGSTSVYTNSSGVLMGAAWNDYAEYRISDCQEPGRVICENGDDTLSLATERLQPAGNVISDTFGFAIGETEMAKTPIAVSGRVLVYPYEDRYSYNPGDAVCAAPGGTVSKMTREEIITYPERIIGTVSAIPEYETWGEGNISVNGRIWIKVK